MQGTITTDTGWFDAAVGQIDGIFHAVDLYFAEAQLGGAVLGFLSFSGKDIGRQSGISIVRSLQYGVSSANSMRRIIGPNTSY